MDSWPNYQSNQNVRAVAQQFSGSSVPVPQDLFQQTYQMQQERQKKASKDTKIMLSEFRGKGDDVLSEHERTMRLEAEARRRAEIEARENLHRYRGSYALILAIERAKLGLQLTVDERNMLAEAADADHTLNVEWSAEQIEYERLNALRSAEEREQAAAQRAPTQTAQAMHDLYSSGQSYGAGRHKAAPDAPELKRMDDSQLEAQRLMTLIVALLGASGRPLRLDAVSAGLEDKTGRGWDDFWYDRHGGLEDFLRQRGAGDVIVGNGWVGLPSMQLPGGRQGEIDFFGGSTSTNIGGGTPPLGWSNIDMDELFGSSSKKDEERERMERERMDRERMERERTDRERMERDRLDRMKDEELERVRRELAERDRRDKEVRERQEALDAELARRIAEEEHQSIVRRSVGRPDPSKSAMVPYSGSSNQLQGYNSPSYPEYGRSSLGSPPPLPDRGQRQITTMSMSSFTTQSSAGYGSDRMQPYGNNAYGPGMAGNQSNYRSVPPIRTPMDVETFARSTVQRGVCDGDESLTWADFDLLFRPMLLHGFTLTKHGRQGEPKRRRFWMTNTLTRLYWDSSKFLDVMIGTGERFIEMGEVVQMIDGIGTDLLRKKAARGEVYSGHEGRFFSLVTTRRTFDLEASSVAQRKVLVRAFSFLISHLGGRRISTAGRAVVPAPPPSYNYPTRDSMWQTGGSNGSSGGYY